MAKYLVVVLNSPTPGKGHDAEFNRWYDETHIPDLKKIAGVTSARRYRTVQGNLPGFERWPYAAVYEIETDDLAAVFNAMETEPQPFTPAYDRTSSVNFVAVQMHDDA